MCSMLWGEIECGVPSPKVWKAGRLFGVKSQGSLMTLKGLLLGRSQGRVWTFASWDKANEREKKKKKKKKKKKHSLYRGLKRRRREG